MTSPRISACIVARNEAANLPACVASIRELVDEIVVLDNGSTDGSAVTAAALGCHVVARPEVILGAARNEALDAAQGDWILVVDPDERLDAAGRHAIARCVAEAPVDVGAYLLPRLTYVGHGRWSHEPALRLWRHDPRVRYGPRLTTHASPAPSIRDLRWRFGAVSVPLHHLDGLVSAHGAAKRVRNVALLGREVEHDPGLHTWLGLELMAAARYSEAREAFDIAIESGRREAEASGAPRERLREYPLWARLFLADLAIIEQHWDQAERIAGELIADRREFAGYARARTIQAEAALRTGRREDAVRLCLDAAAMPPGCAHAHLNLASLLEREAPSLALAHIDAAIACNPYLLNPRIYFGASGGIAALQLTLLSSVRTVAEHAMVAHAALGRAEDVRAWNDTARRISECVASRHPRDEQDLLPLPSPAQPASPARELGP